MSSTTEALLKTTNYALMSCKIAGQENTFELKADDQTQIEKLIN